MDIESERGVDQMDVYLNIITVFHYDEKVMIQQVQHYDAVGSKKSHI